MDAPALQRFGKFVLLRPLGAGDVAETFRAKVASASGLERDVAVKRLLPRVAEDMSFVEVFMTETNASTKLTHRNIAQVYEVGVVGPSCFVAMEVVEGAKLKDVAERSIAAGRPLTAAHCAAIATQLAGALHHIHTRRHRDQPLNMVHRDVSPTNVLVEWSGEVKLTDYGIARAKQRLTQTQAGLVRGKAEYASPEQVGGQALDGRADLFSLGVVLWELLTGRRLFAGENEFETLRNVLKCEVPPVRELNPAVPEELGRIVGRLLAKDLAERTSSASELQLELERYCAAHPPDGELPLGDLVQELFADDIREELRLQAADREAYAAFLAAGAPAAQDEAGPDEDEEHGEEGPQADTADDGDAGDDRPPHDSAPWSAPQPAAEPPAPVYEEPPAVRNPEVEEAEPQSRTGAWVAAVVLAAVGGVLLYYYIQVV